MRARAFAYWRATGAERVVGTLERQQVERREATFAKGDPTLSGLRSKWWVLSEVSGVASPRRRRVVGAPTGNQALAARARSVPRTSPRREGRSAKQVVGLVGSVGGCFAEAPSCGGALTGNQALAARARSVPRTSPRREGRSAKQVVGLVGSVGGCFAEAPSCGGAPTGNQALAARARSVPRTSPRREGRSAKQVVGLVGSVGGCFAEAPSRGGALAARVRSMPRGLAQAERRSAKLGSVGGLLHRRRRSVAPCRRRSTCFRRRSF
jgi:hypothetical protein